MREGLLSYLEAILHKKISRKRFIKLILSLVTLLPLQGTFLNFLSAQTSPQVQSFNGRVKKGRKGRYDLVMAKGENPYQITLKAIEAIGGMSQFVEKGSVVVLKPNIGFDRIPQQAADTNPEIVSALVELCFKAGAKKVKVFDVSANDPRRCYATSGIQKAALEKGATVFFPDHWNIIKARFAYESPLKAWPIIRDAIECDTFINVPILKHHNLTGLTLSMKNLMGVCVGARDLIHQDIGHKLVDLTDFISPDLTVIDSFRVLVRNGPTGGDLRDVVERKTILVSTDSTLADYYACTFMDVNPMSVPYVRYALENNFGITDIKKARIFSFEV